MLLFYSILSMHIAFSCILTLSLISIVNLTFVILAAEAEIIDEDALLAGKPLFLLLSKI